MSNVIPFPGKKRPEEKNTPTRTERDFRPNLSSDDAFRQRMQRIKESLEKINKLLEEYSGKPKKTDKD